MNFEGKGRGPFIQFYSEKDKSKKLPVYLDRDMYNNGDGFTNIDVVNKEFKIKHLPSNIKTDEREILYISGKSGSGKSYYAKQYIKEYKKKYKNRPVYLFTYLTEEDETLKELKINKFKLNDEFLKAELEIDFFKESLVLFDDIDIISNKAILTKVRTILDKILQTGRHAKISCIYTTHTLNNGPQTKLILNESHSIVIFPEGNLVRSIEYLCDKYIGLNKKEIEKIKKIKSRWVTIFNTFPPVIACETNVYIPEK